MLHNLINNLFKLQTIVCLIQAFLDCIQCTSDSITTKAIQQALLDQANNRLKFEQVVDQIVQHGNRIKLVVLIVFDYS